MLKMNKNKKRNIPIHCEKCGKRLKKLPTKYNEHVLEYYRYVAMWYLKETGEQIKVNKIAKILPLAQIMAKFIRGRT